VGIGGGRGRVVGDGRAADGSAVACAPGWKHDVW
jgi:hypothetical protein